MRRCVIAMVVLAVMTGCASNPQQDHPKVVRMSPEELDRLMPKPVPNLSLDEIVALSKAGEKPEAIIARIRDSHSRYALTPQQIVDLHRQGVSMPVLDVMFNDQQQAIRDSLADEFTQRERKHQQEVDALRQELLMRPYPYFYDPFWGPYPYFYYPYPRHWHR